MPRISEFLGIIIAMYHNDHNPPHFHAIYQDFEALVTIETLELLRGSLPRRARSLVIEWAVMHRRELRTNWNRARAGLPLNRVAPLQ